MARYPSPAVPQLQKRLRDPETYEAYIDAYLSQCRPGVRYTRGVAFAAARKEIEGQNPTSCTHARMWWLPHHVEKVAPVSLEDAYYASNGAVVYWRLLAHAKSHAQGATHRHTLCLGDSSHSLLGHLKISYLP
jgi:hypothetical protein